MAMRRGWGQLFPMLAAAAFIIFVTLFRQPLLEFAHLGYLGIAVACAAANATVLLPAPSSAIVFAFGAVYEPFWVALAGGLGATAGELLGFLLGSSGRGFVEQRPFGQRVQSWMTRNGVLTVIVFAFLPLPLFDLVGVAAGIARMNVLLFLGATFIGKFLKMLLYAYAGAGLIPLLEPFLRRALGA
ncbi:VTT domain-containing protein [Anaerolineae bacterium CFX7]|nr:VTT domain-containing protein [Anaerolineae bacterium CFX7]